MATRIVGLTGVPAIKAKLIELVGKGMSVKDACSLVGRSVKTFENYQGSDPEFSKAIAASRVRLKRAVRSDEDPEVFNLSFAEWRKRYLGRETYPHHQLWVDVLEGKEPTLWHPALQYTKGSPRRVLINCPPHHGKSTVLTTEYTTYRLCLNPALRIVIISKTAEFASAFLHSIKTMLTDPEFIDLQKAYGPPDGFKPQRGEGRWANNVIYLADRNLDAADKAAKDPSVIAMGIGSGGIYGRRADLVILDDAIDDNNAHAYAKQFDWLTRTVLSRNKTGIVALVGTRVAPMDLYSHVLNDDIYITGKSPWTVLRTPAVLEYAEDPKDWVTLWPKSSQPLDENLEVEPDKDGMYPAWDGPSCAEARADNRPMMGFGVAAAADQRRHDVQLPMCAGVRGGSSQGWAVEGRGLGSPEVWG